MANDLFDDINNQVVQDEWTYDLLGNFQTIKSGGEGQQWDPAVRFSEPAFINDGDGNPLELLNWDGQGRLTERFTTNKNYRYAYDGAGRLDSAEVNGGSHYYGYNVDDELIFEDHKSYRVYRFGSYRYASNDKRVIVKPVPQIALITKSGKTTSRWMFLEPDGHALESAGDVLGQAAELSFDILGAFGRTLASSGDVLPIDGFHGADADLGVGVVPFGVRHVVKDVGIWMQPEPLLYLGLTNQGAAPRRWSGVYAVGNPLAYGDRSGFTPTDEQFADGTAAGQSLDGAFLEEVNAMRANSVSELTPSGRLEDARALAVDPGRELSLGPAPGLVRGEHHAVWDQDAHANAMADGNQSAGGGHTHGTNGGPSQGDTRNAQLAATASGRPNIELVVSPDRVSIIVATGSGVHPQIAESSSAGVGLVRNPVSGNYTQESAQQYESTFGVLLYEAGTDNVIRRPSQDSGGMSMTIGDFL